MILTITKELAENTNYSDAKNCALAKTVKEMGISNDPVVGDETIWHSRKETKNIIGKISPKFTQKDWQQLIDGDIKEFKITFTFQE